MKKTFKIPVSWQVCGEIEIEAETLEEAIEIFDKNEDEGFGYSLPTDNDYVEGSFERESVDFIQEYNSLIS